MRNGVEGCGFVEWFGQYADIAFLVLRFGFTQPILIEIQMRKQNVHGHDDRCQCNETMLEHNAKCQVPMQMQNTNANTICSCSVPNAKSQCKCKHKCKYHLFILFAKCQVPMQMQTQMQRPFVHSLFFFSASARSVVQERPVRPYGDSRTS